MPDLLTHAFIAYIFAMAVSWRYAWLDGRYVTVAMAGAFIPDIAKITLLVADTRVSAFIDLLFSWFGIHTAGGTLLCVFIGVVLVSSQERRRVGWVLSAGAASHLIADAFLMKAYGHSYPLLWPLTAYAPPTPGLYLSTDVWPAIVTGSVAVGVWVIDRRLPKTTYTE
ncbi:metal-dependent hydrolase [Halorubrum sp. GN11GM_10-3_MGM]|uniref:metal-dependent hydrolase n=1 Tax=Halorubrum sp. GN11GM_10-3_MGM TaxID=2518111 RepID=UPI0010FA5CA4|nr:metal-dependent hydrolase [Halorubrum sp. GN11GM_10-3_MGM]TKX71841.1 metal-dependent hydrolase [Halorubrum sp. GN11GM_10-3_MGM]